MPFKFLINVSQSICDFAASAESLQLSLLDERLTLRLGVVGRDVMSGKLQHVV